MNEAFANFSRAVAHAAGSPWAFLLAAAAIIVWTVTGFIHGFSDTLQLVINTATTIVTFLMVFIIQNTQNRDTAALNIKLNELLRAVAEADQKLALAEDLPPEELEEKLRQQKP